MFDFEAAAASNSTLQAIKDIIVFVFFLIFSHCKIWRNERVQGLRLSRLYGTAGIAVSPTTTAYKQM
jgi:hypothetical protein